MPLDFAIKDFYRKKEISLPYLFMIIMVISATTFLIYLTTSTGLNSFIIYEFDNPYFFSGGISIIYINYSILIVSLMMTLAFVIVIIISSTLIITKKRDIAIMRALGSIPRRLYGFYLTEVYLIFLIGFAIGFIIGLLSFGIVAWISSSLGFSIFFHLDFFYTPLLFFSCIIGIFIVPGYILRKFGNQKIIKSFSKEIPYDYNAAKGLSFIPKWLSKIGFNFKISIVNTLRRKGEFKRYVFVFSAILLIIFTLSLGIFVLGTSTKEWINKSQNNNIIAIGHRDVISNYTLMYSMFSNPNLLIDSSNIDFLNQNYLFNSTNLEDLHNLTIIKAIDERLIFFSNAEELNGYHYYEDGGYELIGQQRTGNFPIIGLNVSNKIQNFELEGRFFTESDSYNYLVIGDGLAYNFFDYAFDQSIFLDDMNHTFKPCGVVIDSFYSGYNGYVDIQIIREELNYNNNEINLLLLKYDAGSYNSLKVQLESIINTNLGIEFTFINLKSVFENNLEYITNISLYPTFLIVIMVAMAVLSIYNYHKGRILEKAKDFLIMRAIGSKYRSIRRILFLESLYILIPSILLSLGVGMILNSIVLFDRVHLPHIFLPFLLIFILLLLFLFLNFLSLLPIIRRIKKNFTIKDFEIY